MKLYLLVMGAFSIVCGVALMRSHADFVGNPINPNWSSWQILTLAGLFILIGAYVVTSSLLSLIKGR